MFNASRAMSVCSEDATFQPKISRAHFGDEGDVDPASLGGHVGDVRNPQLVEITGPKMPIDQVQGACMARRWG